jgi:hypothetical protein
MLVLVDLLKKENAFRTGNFARVIAACNEIKINQVDTKGYAGSDFAQRHVVTSYIGALDAGGRDQAKGIAVVVVIGEEAGLIIGMDDDFFSADLPK